MNLDKFDNAAFVNIDAFQKALVEMLGVTDDNASIVINECKNTLQLHGDTKTALNVVVMEDRTGLLVGRIKPTKTVFTMLSVSIGLKKNGKGGYELSLPPKRNRT